MMPARGRVRHFCPPVPEPWDGRSLSLSLSDELLKSTLSPTDDGAMIEGRMIPSPSSLTEHRKCRQKTINQSYNYPPKNLLCIIVIDKYVIMYKRIHKLNNHINCMVLFTTTAVQSRCVLFLGRNWLAWGWGRWHEFGVNIFTISIIVFLFICTQKHTQIIKVLSVSVYTSVFLATFMLVYLFSVQAAGYPWPVYTCGFHLLQLRWYPSNRRHRLCSLPILHTHTNCASS